jgi:hypothetical protein
LNISQIEENIKKLLTDFQTNNVTKAQFVYDFLLAYGHRKSSVSRVKTGERNLSKVAGEVRWKRHVYFKYVEGDNLRLEADKLKNDKALARERIRFVIVTDFTKFLAIDIKTGDSLDINFDELVKHFDFFLPWAGMEKAVYQGENPADVKAAEKMAKLFDLIKADNFSEENKDDTNALHNLNVFLTRLLFCFFAEDTGIFKQNQFSAELESHTKIDGSDVDNYLNRLFAVLNTSKEIRGDLPVYLANFEYVNGGLFANNIVTPRFSTKSRKMLIECGSELDWSDINPDIFGSMIQAVVHPDQRGGMGMHYTSVTNIMKVIEPLFLDELYAELENIEDNIDAKLKPSRLRKLHDRIAEIKIFDPACGSGNFLIIAFKKLRKLEMEIIKRLQELKQNDNQDDLFGDVGLASSFSCIKLSQFYGIELDDFAHEVAILSLWLAEHQMNVEFKAEFGECQPALPLKSGGDIICGNALTIEWEKVCPRNNSTFIIGNPPYLGDKLQSQKQKIELKEIFTGIKNSKAVDYITGWFMKASEYIQQSGQYAFVSTNSICQGIQVPLLWPHVYSKGLEISFCHRGFTWGNNAKNKAAVICVIVGVRKRSGLPKYIFDNGLKLQAENINAYLLDAPNLIVEKNAKPISILPPMLTGNIPRDKGHLMLNLEERNSLLNEYPEAEVLVRHIVGSKEYINSIQRWCLWITDEQKELAYSIPELRNRFDKIVEYRTHGSERGKLGISTPYKFERTLKCTQSQLVIPRVSSERRRYIPVGYLNNDVIISDAAQAIYDAEPYIFSLISSRMHMCWVGATAGRMKSDFRYSSGVCYNSFPIPELSSEHKAEMNALAMNILSTREEFPVSTLADLYDPDKMPELLLEVHKSNDLFIESIYTESTFSNDSKRLECLFNLYNEMTGSQNA